jgi:hypothetical protein
MEPEISLLCSKEPFIGPYPETDESSPSTASYFFKIRFNIILPPMPTSLSS